MAVFEHGTSYVCEKSTGPQPTCDFKSGKIILQQVITSQDMSALLGTGKTPLLENFVSNKTRRKFKAHLAFDAKAGKVVFEFEPRVAKAAAKNATKAATKPAAKLATKTPAKKAARKKSSNPIQKPSDEL
jgi:DNA topoisomerase-3